MGAFLFIYFNAQVFNLVKLHDTLADRQSCRSVKMTNLWARRVEYVNKSNHLKTVNVEHPVWKRGTNGGQVCKCKYEL